MRGRLARRIISVFLMGVFLGTFMLEPVVQAAGMEKHQAQVQDAVSTPILTQIMDVDAILSPGNSPLASLTEEQTEKILAAIAQTDELTPEKSQALQALALQTFSPLSSTSQNTRVKANLQDLLDANQDTTDTDADGLPDLVERILGTSPDEADSDFDKLDDYYEVENGLDPINPDSNDDGVSDWIEIQQNGALDPAKDSDGDGEADVWDEDNDGDGVSDRVDISPFASTEIKDYHRCRYYVNKHDLLVDIQVQPEDTGLIKWNGQTWNWPHDELGNMQDADDSSDDLELKPMLELNVYDAPDQEDVEDYGIVVVKGENLDDKVYVPLNTVTDGGDEVCLTGRMYFPGDEEDSSDFLMQECVIQLVWIVEAKNDSCLNPAASTLHNDFSFSHHTQGGGLAIGDLDQNGTPDILFMAIDNPDQSNTFRYFTGWNVDANGNPQSYSSYYNSPCLGWTNSGGDAALYDIDGDGKLELVLMGIDNPGNNESKHFWYMIGSNMNECGEFEDWTPIIHIKDDIYGAISTSGGGVALGLIDDDSLPDMVMTAVVDVDGENIIAGRIAFDIDAEGNYTSLSPFYVNNSDRTFGCYTQGAGLDIADLNGNGRPDYIFGVVDNPDGANRHRYFIGWDANILTGIPGSFSERIEVAQDLAATTTGGGLAIGDIDNDGQKDLAFMSISDLDGPDQMQLVWGMDMSAANSYGINTVGTSLTAPPFMPDDTNMVGSCLADINGDDQLDVLVANYDWSQSKTVVDYAIGWNMSKDGRVKGWTPYRTLTEISVDQIPYKGGMTLYDVDGNNQLDLVLVGLTSRTSSGSSYTGKFWYKIGWNIDAGTGAPSSWSSLLFSPLLRFDRDSVQDVGVALGDINGNDTADILLMGMDASYDTEKFEKIADSYYVVGWDLNSSGSPANNAWSGKTSLPQLTYTGRGGDIALADLNGNDQLDLVLMSENCNNATSGDEYKYQVGWDLGEDGTVTGNWTSTAKIEGPDNDQYCGGITLGDIDGNGSLDLLFMSFYGNSTEYKLYYKTAWNVSYNGPTVLTKYYTPFRITGMEATECYSSYAAIFYSSDQEQTIRSYADLRYDFLNSGNPLSDAQSYLSDEEISVSSRSGSFSNPDLACQAINDNYLPNALDSLADGKQLPVVIATEDLNTFLDLADSTETGYMRIFDLRDKDVETVKALKMSWFDTDDNTMLEDDALPDIAAAYTDYSDEEQCETLKLLYVWDLGETRITKMGDKDVYQYDEDEHRQTMSYVKTGVAGLKYLVKFSPYANGMKFFITSTRNANHSLAGIQKTFTASLKYIKVIRGSNVIPGDINKINQLTGASLSKTQIGKFSAVSGYATKLRRLGVGVGVGISFYTAFQMANCGDWSDDALAGAGTYLGLTVSYYALIELIDTLSTVLAGTAGTACAIVSALIILSDFITAMITGQGWSERAIMWVVSQVYTVKPCVALDLQMTDNNCEISDPDGNGWTVGDKITISNQYKATVNATSRGDSDDVERDYIRPWIHFSNSQNYTWKDTENIRKEYSADGLNKVSTYDLSSSATFNTAGINIPAELLFRCTYYMDYSDGSTDTDYDDSYHTSYYDVLPNSLEEFLAWDAIEKNDQDLDGLLDTGDGTEQDEDGNVQNTDASKWDSDDDGLSDDFELDNKSDPNLADSDSDGLDDRREFLLKTDPNNADSDGDGLSDLEELTARSINVTIGGKTISISVLSDPLDADSDDDGLNDKTEYDQALNPYSQDTDGDGNLDGDDPAPKHCGAKILSTTPLQLYEYGMNDGSLDPNTVKITLTNGHFTSTTLETEGNFWATNLPEGMSFVTSMGRDNVIMYIKGNAVQHSAADSIDDLTFTISKDIVTGAENDLTTPEISIEFTDTASTGASISATEPTSLTEADANDGSLQDGIIVLTIADGTLAEDISRDDMGVSNLPSGLKFTVTRTDDTHLTIHITGQAINHYSSNSTQTVLFWIARDAVNGALDELYSSHVSIVFRNQTVLDRYPVYLIESSASDGTLSENELVITVENGKFAEDISTADVTSLNLPSGFDYSVSRTDDTHVKITISGAALENDNEDDLCYEDNVLWFTFSQNKIIGATRNEQLNFFIDFMDPQPAAPTNPVVDDDNNAFAWTNTPGFDSLDDYEYSLDSGSSWLNCTGNPQDIKNVDLAAGAVQVRVKEVIKESNGNYVRPAGAALLSDQAYTIPGHSAGNMNGAGVTIIIHGWQPVSGEPSWTGAMQEAIIEKALGNEGAAGKITVTGSKGNLSVSCNSWDFDLANAANGEIVIRVDWSAVANHLLTGVTAQEVAAAIAPKIYEGQNGQAALSELPIHLIGHSRGGGMVYELARLLGEQGIEVEQVTSLDPHPLTTSDTQGLSAPWGPGKTIDTPVQVYENILFADNYWQSVSYPKGEHVNGTYNRKWTNLSGGYHNHSNTAYSAVADHLNIHLLYDGTVDLDTPVSDNQAWLDSSERSGWFNSYENEGEKTGFYFSRIYGGDRKSTDTPVEDGDRVVDGYNNDSLLGGAGERQALAWSNAAWPNIITLDVLRDGESLDTGIQTINIGEELELTCTYNDYDSSSTVRFYADQDCNPYNDNNLGLIAVQNLSATGSDMEESSTPWQTTSLSASDNYYVYAAINDGSKTRYLYAPQIFKEAAPLVSALNQPAKPVLNNKIVTWTAVANENNGYTLRIYQGGVLAGTVNIDHGAALQYDLLSLLVTSGTYTVTITALGTGNYTDSPESEPSGALYILDEGELDGQIQLPSGVTSLPVNGEGSIDLSSGTRNAADQQIIIGGQTISLNTYTGGDLSNMDLSGLISVGNQTVEIQKAVRLESGINGIPITLSNSQLKDLVLTIPDGTALLMPAGWDGTVRVPQLIANTTAGPSGYTVGDSVYELGNPHAIMLFDRPVIIEIKGVSKPMAYKLSGSDTWRQITQEAGGTYDYPTAPEFPGEAYISNGTDTKIITWHLTAFAGLEEETADECFIATACYGSKFEAHVALLRHFRDRFLLTNELGKKFVAFYYKNSPPIAAVIAGNDVLKILVRTLLLPVVCFAYVSFHPLSVLVILLAFILLLAGRRKYSIKRV